MKLTQVQKALLEKPCPQCKVKELGVVVTGENEVCLHCYTCDINIDSSGGYVT